MTKNLFLIRGVSGSGKSTLAELLADAMLDAWRIETDDYFLTPANDGTTRLVYRFDPSKLPQAHAWCQMIVESQMALPRPTILVSNTFTQRWEMEPYLALAHAYGYTVTEIIVKTNLTDDQLAARNTHGVMAHQIAKQRRKFQP